MHKYRPIAELTVLSAIAFTIHYLLFIFVWPERPAVFRYPLALLYGFFYACSLVIIFVLIRMKEKNIDSVGNTFMLLTCIKMVLAVVLLHPILQPGQMYFGSEKANIFAVFAIFLAVETIVSIRILNKN